MDWCPYERVADESFGIAFQKDVRAHRRGILGAHVATDDFAAAPSPDPNPIDLVGVR